MGTKQISATWKNIHGRRDIELSCKKTQSQTNNKKAQATKKKKNNHNPKQPHPHAMFLCFYMEHFQSAPLAKM